MGLISIVTIVRNDKLGLTKTRQSVASQNFRDFEWLVIDGASTDGTAQVVLSLDEPYVSATSEPDKGIYDAMNKGLSRASGEFVLFLNAGDIFAHNNVLDLVARRLCKAKIDFLYGDSLEQYGGVQLIYKVARGHRRVNYGMFGCHQAMYYRRSLVGGLRYKTDFRIAGDYCFTAEFLQKRPRIERLHEALCIFDLQGASIKNRRCGRKENWIVQRDVLGLPLIYRFVIRAAYVCSALLANQLPAMYRILRYRIVHVN